MGNYLSCTLAKASAGRAAVKVVLPDGRVCRFSRPVSAAELMLDAPGHFLAEVRSMQLGRRLTALSADEELEMTGVYVMLPMKRLNAVAVPADMARLLVLASKEAKRGLASARVQPDSVANVQEAAEVDAVEIGEFKHRLSCGRSRRPALETIHEENLSSR